VEGVRAEQMEETNERQWGKQIEYIC
jgi:hypothetical protein